MLFEEVDEKLLLLNRKGCMGDINLDSNANVSTTNDYLHVLRSNAFFNLITKPTGVTSSSHIPIDHVLTNDSESSIKPGVFHYIISEHLPIFCEIRIPRDKLPLRPIINPYTYRCTEHVGGSKFWVHLENAQFLLADEFSSDANLPLCGEFRRFCCQKSHFRESSKSVETI